MSKNFEIEATASVIDEDSVYLDVSKNLKVGDALIEISYSSDNPEIKHPYLGSITVFSNGVINLLVSNKLYVDRLYHDYKIISGESFEPKPTDFDPYAEITSPDMDRTRFLRAKQFLDDNNIELIYSEEEKVDEYYYDKYFSKTVDDLVEGSNKLEEKDYDEGEYHHSPLS